MKILVFGGTGAIGSAVVDFLSDKGNNVYVTSRRNQKNRDNICYICGNAHQLSFVRDILNEDYDALIDFMVYSENELKERVDLFLGRVEQYFFISSARVYAESDNPLIENSDRLLDVCDDPLYLKTTEYALIKAREENIFLQSEKKNWTIIRPYITYSDNRLQFGVLEKEYWLQRALQGKTIVFSKKIFDKYTTMTYGLDVARHIAELVGNGGAYGQIFQITNDKEIKWSDVLKIYEKVITEITNQKLNVILMDNDEGLNWLLGTQYQIKYDRGLDRRFNSAKVNILTDDYSYIDTSVGLEGCLRDFLSGSRTFLCTNWKLEGYFDRLTGERTKLRDIDTFKHRVAYFIYRYTHYLEWKRR